MLSTSGEGVVLSVTRLDLRCRRTALEEETILILAAPCYQTLGSMYVESRHGTIVNNNVIPQAGPHELEIDSK